MPGVDLDERTNNMLNRLVNREDAVEVVEATLQLRPEPEPEEG